MPASHHSLFLTPLRVLACLALLSVVAAGIAITVILSQSTNPMFSIPAGSHRPRFVWHGLAAGSG